MSTLSIKDMELRAYELWIQENVKPDEAIGECTLWTRVMQQAFPELIRVEGYIKNKFSSQDYHEYLLTPCGKIVDPTRSQFDFMFGDKWEYLPERTLCP